MAGIQTPPAKEILVGNGSYRIRRPNGMWFGALRCVGRHRANKILAVLSVILCILG
jgi:hypothetical protein